jgi:hypothetical protein
VSILTDLISKKITFSTAATEVGQWLSRLVTGNVIAQQAASTVLSDLKQAASNAVALADGALGPIVLVGSTAVEAAANSALTSALGPNAGALTPAVDHAIETIAQALKAEIDAAATKARAALTPAPAPQ